MNELQTTIEVIRYLLPILAFGTSVYFVRRFVIALERRASNNAELAEVRARIAELEEARDVTERDVIRLQTASEFAVQLLAGKMQDEPNRLR